jgi:hypothetical protein
MTAQPETLYWGCIVFHAVSPRADLAAVSHDDIYALLPVDELMSPSSAQLTWLKKVIPDEGKVKFIPSELGHDGTGPTGK